MENSRFLFADLSDETRDLKPSYYFMMRSLLHSRVDLGDTSDDEGKEQDVNVYLAHLLQSFGDPGYLEAAKPYLHRYDHEVFGRLARSTDARLKYKIYKTNADFLLISIGIFDNPTQALLQRVHTPASLRRLQEPTEEASISRGRTYYEFAYQYSQLVPSRRPAVSEVLDKLAQGFERYARILAHLRGEYMDIVQHLSRGEVYHLEQTVNAERRRELLLEAQDEFLDAYAEWRRSGDDPSKARLAAAVDAVRRLDPEFTFDPARPDEDDDTEDDDHPGGHRARPGARRPRGKEGPPDT